MTKAVATSPETTDVSDHFGSVSVFDATYFGFVFKAPTMGFPRSSRMPQ